MYENFFGFKERPFQLVPNPSYLFLSKSHEEALAHLTYAMLQGDGFVEITGEVGTGKTMLCRTFLESLDKNTEAAYIFNPKLDGVDLLKAVNDEFGISSTADTAKCLIDTLNTFLMQKKAEGKNILLVIDEAQNLSKEVLEQIRLLSNLETTTAKLVQIILVGQPELREMLDSYELRQLGQRITLSYHLIPLNFKETRAYIQHRIQIASRKPGLRFTLAAYVIIFRYSGGTPRLINIACDRAILTAFSMEQHKITGATAKAAIRELAGRKERNHYSSRGSEKSVYIFALLCLILTLLVFFYPSFVFKPDSKNKKNTSESSLSEKRNISEKHQMPTVSRQEPGSEKKNSAPVSTDIAAKTSTPETVSKNSQTLKNFLITADSRSSRNTALQIALECWYAGAEIKKYSSDSDNGMDDETFLHFAANQNNLMLYRTEWDAGLIRKLNLPAILRFYPSEASEPVYLALTRTEGEKLIFTTESEIIIAISEEIQPYTADIAYILWKNFYPCVGTIPRNAPPQSVMILKMLLRDIGYNVDMTPVYDKQTRKIVESVQEKNGIRVDGVVGPLTKIILYNELPSLNIPRIVNQ